MRQLLILLIAATLFVPNLEAQVDTTYIGEYKLKTALNVGLSKDFLSLMHEFSGSENNTYLPNNPMGVSLGLSMYNTVLSFNIGRSFDFMREKDKGTTESFDFQMHGYGSKFVYDIFIQNYKGFYMENKDDKFQEIVPDLRIRQYSANGSYVFNNKKFSYSAAFNNNKKQLKSAGSFLVGADIVFTKMTADSLIVRNRNSESGDVFRNFQVGVHGGYAHSFALGKHWLVSGSINLGINFGSSEISTFGRHLEVYPSVFPRLSASYMREEWAISFSYVNKINFLSFQNDAQVSMLAGKLQFNYIYRINDIPILSKIFR